MYVLIRLLSYFFFLAYSSISPNWIDVNVDNELYLGYLVVILFFDSKDIGTCTWQILSEDVFARTYRRICKLR